MKSFSDTYKERQVDLKKHIYVRLYFRHVRNNTQEERRFSIITSISLHSRCQGRSSFQSRQPWWFPGYPLDLLWSTLPPHGASSWDIGMTAAQARHNSNTSWLRLHPCLPCPSCRLHWPWAAESQKINTHLPDDRTFHICGTSCWSEGSLLECDPCFRILDMLAASLVAFTRRCPRLNVHRSRLRLSRGIAREIATTSLRKSVHFFKVSTRISRWTFSCDSGNLIRNVPILISSSKTLPLSCS